jgi:hypothetical protein
MAEALDRVTRVAADLVESAAAEGARQSRSAKQQLDHWARVGRAVSSQHTASRRRVEAALAGQLATGELTVEEGVVFNAEISAAVEESLARINYGAALAGQGSPRWPSTRPARSSSIGPTAPRWSWRPSVDRDPASVGGSVGPR